ncbi:MAG: hypothetical protein VYC80_13990, partial [Planctomycetota bacterium]|nr:hypothetical protein [Planctomycetota bacterium]
VVACLGQVTLYTIEVLFHRLLKIKLGGIHRACPFQFESALSAGLEHLAVFNGRFVSLFAATQYHHAPRYSAWS